MIEKYDSGNINEVYRLKNEFVDLILRQSKFNNDFETYVLKKLEQYKLDVPLHIMSYSIGNQYIMLYEYIEGEIIKTISNDEIDQIAQFLLRLHSIEVTKEEIDLHQPREDLHSLHQYIQKLEGKISKREYDFVCDQYEFLHKGEKNFAILDKCFIHSDIKKENLLINKGKLYVIDFGNCYIGSRLVDIIRTIMWLFLFNEVEINFRMIGRFCSKYFGDWELSKLEYNMLPLMVRFCLLYNYVKDKYLYSIGALSETYVNATSTSWLDILENENIISQVVETIRNERPSWRI